MIRVEVEEYCHSCLDFSPDVIMPRRYESLDHPDKEFVLGDTIIHCEHRKRCANIKRYLERQAKGETV